MIVLIRCNIDGWYEAVCRDCPWRSEPGTWRDACLAKAAHGLHLSDGSGEENER